MRIQFTGTVENVQKQADDWVRENPEINVIWRSGAIRAGRSDGEDAFAKADWTVTIDYEDPA